MARDGETGRDPFESFHDPDEGASESAKPRSASDFPGKSILSGGSPREILARLVDGDPLEIGPRCSQRIRKRCLLIEYDRLVLRAMARAAHAGFSYRGKPALAEWLAQRVDDAVDDLLREDEEAEHQGLPPTEPYEQRFLFVSELTGLAPTQGRRACARFNALPDPARRAFFGIVVEQKRFNRFVAEGNGPPAKLRTDLEDAFEALSSPLDPGFDLGIDFRGGE